MNNTLDPIGELAGPTPPDVVGWRRVGVWFGDEVGGDHALSLAYTTAYQFDFGGSLGSQCVDVAYYVVGSEEDYSVEECNHIYRRDNDGEPIESADEDYTYDYGCPLSYCNFDAALNRARELSLVDQGYWLAHWKPEP